MNSFISRSTSKSTFRSAVVGLFLAAVGTVSAAPEESYIDKLRAKHGIPEQSYQGSNAEFLKKAEASARPAPVEPEVSYTESLRSKAGPSDRQVPGDSYIQSLREGKTLEAKYRKTVNQAIGVSIPASSNLSVTSSPASASFDAVYRPSEKYIAGVDLFYETQFLRDPSFGTFGLATRLSVYSVTGKGIFRRTGASSEDVRFRLTAFPIGVGPTYRLNQLKLIAPFIQAGLAGVPMLESRDDGKDTHRAFSWGYYAVSGVALNLDWIYRPDSWAMYSSNGYVHTNLLLRYNYLSAPTRGIRLSYRGFQAGLLFEV